MQSTNDEIIPPSPVLDKLKRKKRKSTNRKKQTPILSLNSKKKASAEQSDRTIDDDDTPIIIDLLTPEVDADENLGSKVTNILYDGLTNDDDAVIPVVDDFDMLHEARLLEEADENDMRNVVAVRTRPATKLLTSVKDLIDAQSVNIYESDAHVEADDIFDENLVFSEWQIPFDRDKSMSPPRTGSFVPNNAAQTIEAVKSNDELTIAQSIRRDFNCDNISSDEEPDRTPPVILIRRQNPKTYHRPAHRIPQRKTLIFPNSQCESNKSLDADDIQCKTNDESIDIDFDLDSSRQIKENISSLSAFFTQPENYKLDFSADLSQPDFDDQPELAASQLTAKKNDDHQIHDFFDKNDDDLMLSSFKTPANMKKKRKRDLMAEQSTLSTPSTSKHSANADVLSETQISRGPKRLRFDECVESEDLAGFESVEVNANRNIGFSTANGQTIQMSTSAKQRTMNVFADIDAECTALVEKSNRSGTNSIKAKYPVAGYVDAEKIESAADNPRNRPVQTNAFQTAGRSTDFRTANRSNDFQLANRSGGFQAAGSSACFKAAGSSAGFKAAGSSVGFQTARGSKVNMNKSILHGAMKMFGENFEDLDSNQHGDESTNDINALPLESPAIKQMTGFRTAGRSNDSATVVSSDGLRMAGRAPAFQKPNQPTGFQTAGGSKVKMNEAVLRNAMQMFGESFGDLDNNQNDEPHRHENDSHDREAALMTFPKANEPVAFQTANQPAGFQTARGNKVKMNDAARRSAMTFFGEEFNDIDVNEPHVNGPLHPKQQPKASGFATAGGSNIKISETNRQKHAQIFDDIDRNIPNGPKPMNSPLVCRTPMNKQMQRAKMFATSTPMAHDNRMAEHMANLSPVTPINRTKRNNAVEHDDLDLNYDEISNLFEDYQPSPLGRQNLSEAIPIGHGQNDIDVDVLNIAESIKMERREATVMQQAECLKKPSQIYPNMGTLSLRKILNAKQPLNQIDCPGKYSVEQLKAFGLPMNVIHVSADNVIKFKFDMWHYYENELCRTNVKGINMSDDMLLIMDDKSRAGFTELTNAFLSCKNVDPKLIPDQWIANAIKWIIIKLAGLERSYPNGNAGKCLTPENVLLQLKYRYDREIDRVERPAIRKIVEQDDTAMKRMVLFVNRVIQKNLEYTLELSDGWYSIGTTPLDVMLTKAVQSGKITVGTKLVVQGAELVGCEEPCHPLEVRFT